MPCQYPNDDSNKESILIDLKGLPWSLENEKDAWGMLSFPDVPSNEQKIYPLSATQIQGYVTQQLCPRWARFQQCDYQIESHPRFSGVNQEMQSRQEQGIAFKKTVIATLENLGNVYFETAEWTWQEAIRTVVLNKNPIFLVQAKFKIEGSINACPDLIYIQHQGSHICLEVWDIKFSHFSSYAQKWRIAFYAYLLDDLLKKETFTLPVKVSVMGGLVYPSIDTKKQFEKQPFVLAPYKAWMPRLIAQWNTDSRRSSAVHNYSMEFSCTTCRYFSYCYQETLYKEPLVPKNQTIVSRNIESNDFPKNSKHWYFIHCDKENIHWQCWENGISIIDVCVRVQDFLNLETENLLQKAWIQSVNQEKNPHILVFEPAEWHLFQKTFQSTSLKTLWSSHTPWTSIQTILKTHFFWPIEGRITPRQVAACLGILDCTAPPLSLYHKEPFSDSSFDLYKQIWNWCLSNVKSQRVVSFEGKKKHSAALIHTYLAVHKQETECRVFDISQFQKNPLPDRVKQFRAIGPIAFLGSLCNKEGYEFSIEAQSVVSKFRVGDFLKLSPVGSDQKEDGISVILDTYLPQEGVLSVRSLSQKVSFSKNQRYVLDEDPTDWNAPKVTKLLNLLKDPKFCPEVMQMLLGHTKKFTCEAVHWVEQWYQSRAITAGLNSIQKQALTIPFREKIGFIEGPPGTGKTHLLIWTLIALVAHAKSLNRSIKILVTAQTHHAIDQILRKVAKTMPQANSSSVALWKYGRFDEAQCSKLGARPSRIFTVFSGGG